MEIIDEFMRHAANKYTHGIEIIFNPKKSFTKSKSPSPFYTIPWNKKQYDHQFYILVDPFEKKIFSSEYNFIGEISHLPSVCKNGSDMKKLGRKGQEPSKKLTQFFNLLRWSTQYLCWASVLQLAVR